jgi:heme/copper-type cytochrome/quinol oxidase subunit 2
MEVNTTSTTDPVNMYDYINSIFLNPIFFIVIGLVVLAYFILFSSLGKGNGNQDINIDNYSSDNFSGQNILAIIVIAIVIILLIANILQYFFSINVTAYITDLFTDKPKIDIEIDQTVFEKDLEIPYQNEPVPEILNKNQVFNIPGNYYNYNNAKALCSAYGARLASYKEVEDTYNEGGEWCNYGWSEEQMALFPTQLDSYNNLQNIKGHEHDCGRPGVNGGYIANPEVRFGVNCYGHKPKMTDEEEEIMKTTTSYPLTKEDTDFQKRVDFWKNNIDNIVVSPFNHNLWSKV